MINALNDCDHLLVLTAKKKVVEHINSGIVADQKNERFFRETHDKSHSMKPKSSQEKIVSHMSKVKTINRKHATRSEKKSVKKRVISLHVIRTPSKRKKLTSEEFEEVVPSIIAEDKTS